RPAPLGRSSVHAVPPVGSAPAASSDPGPQANPSTPTIGGHRGRGRGQKQRRSVDRRGIFARRARGGSTMASSSSDAAAEPLAIGLFGPFSVRRQGDPLPPLRTRKGQWLLALLTLRHEGDVDRAWL